MQFFRVLTIRSALPLDMGAYARTVFHWMLFTFMNYVNALDVKQDALSLTTVLGGPN